MFKADPITRVDATFPVRVEVDGELLQIWLDETRAIDAKLTESVTILDAAGVSRTAWRWIKQQPAAGGQFADNEDGVKGYLATDPIPTWPAFGVNGAAGSVGAVVRLYPGFRDSRSPSVNYDIEWYFFGSGSGGGGIKLGGNFAFGNTHWDYNGIEHIDLFPSAYQGTSNPGGAWNITIDGTDSTRAYLTIRDAGLFNPGIVNVSSEQYLGNGTKYVTNGLGFGETLGGVQAVGFCGSPVVLSQLYNRSCYVDGSTDNRYTTLAGILASKLMVGADYGSFNIGGIESVYNHSYDMNPIRYWGQSTEHSVSLYQRMVFTATANTDAAQYINSGGAFACGSAVSIQGGINIRGFSSPFLFGESTQSLGGTLGSCYGVMIRSMFGPPMILALGQSGIFGGLQFISGLYIGGSLQVSLANEVTGTLSIGHGGTNQTTFIPGALITYVSSGDQLTSIPNTRTTAAGNVQFKLATNQWLGFSSGNY